MPDVTASSIECGFGFPLYHGGNQRRRTTFLEMYRWSYRYRCWLAELCPTLKNCIVAPTKTNNGQPATRLPTTWNQQHPLTATPGDQQSSLDIRHLTINDKQLYPTETPDNQSPHPTANSQQRSKKIQQDKVKRKLSFRPLSTQTSFRQR